MISMRLILVILLKNRLVYQGDLGVIRIMMSVMLLLYCLHTVVIVPLLAVMFAYFLCFSCWYMTRTLRYSFRMYALLNC